MTGGAGMRGGAAGAGGGICLAAACGEGRGCRLGVAHQVRTRLGEYSRGLVVGGLWARGGAMTTYEALLSLAACVWGALALAMLALGSLCAGSALRSAALSLACVFGGAAAVEPRAFRRMVAGLAGEYRDWLAGRVAGLLRG